MQMTKYNDFNWMQAPKTQQLSWNFYLDILYLQNKSF